MFKIRHIYYMGSTESQDKSRLEREYRLVRRFISEFYGGGQITIIEHKQTKEQLALREVVTQFAPATLLRQLDSRQQLTHRSLIQLRTYWLENDLNICSNLNKLYAIFEYHENTLEDAIAEATNKPTTDNEVVDFVRQSLNALSFLQRNQMIYLLAGPRSIAVAQEDEREGRERASDDAAVGKGGRLVREGNQRQRCSLADLNRKYFANNETVVKEKGDGEKRKKVYKLFEPFQGFSSTKTFYNLQNYLQVPMHPQLATAAQDQILLPDSLVKLQNLFTVVLIALALAEGCEIYDLDVLKSGRLSLEKVKVRIDSLRDSHPKSAGELMKAIAVRGVSRESPARSQQSLKLKDFSFLLKRDESRNASKQAGVQTGQSPAHRVGRVHSRKRISLLQL